MNKRDKAKRRAEKDRLEPRRKQRYADLMRPTQTEWRSRDERDLEIEVVK